MDWPRPDAVVAGEVTVEPDLLGILTPAALRGGLMEANQRSGRLCVLEVEGGAGAPWRPRPPGVPCVSPSN